MPHSHTRSHETIHDIQRHWLFALPAWDFYLENGIHVCSQEDENTHMLWYSQHSREIQKDTNYCSRVVRGFASESARTNSLYTIRPKILMQCNAQTSLKNAN